MAITIDPAKDSGVDLDLLRRQSEQERYGRFDVSMGGRDRGGRYEPYYYLLHSGRKINIRAGDAGESERIVEALLEEISYYRARSSPSLIPPPQVYTPQYLNDANSAMSKLAASPAAIHAELNKSPAQSEKLLLLP